MSASAHAIKIQDTSESVTKISANARIDYILRFSKQAVLVVDDDLEQCSSVASQFLANLPAHHNAAFISVSAKLNNIQVRCRLIEQLFNNDFFDPEQSIAVSLINLVKQKKQAISIVVNNAHFLSLQLLHELCQLADIAKKADYKISVLLLGSPQAGTIAANNSQLFNKKLSIISAQTGQLLSLHAQIFKVNHSIFKWNAKKKLLCAVLLITSALLAVLTWVLTSKPTSFSGLTSANTSKISVPVSANVEPSQFAAGNELKVKQLPISTPQKNRAAVADVLRAIETPLTTNNNKQQNIVLALPADIVSALENNDLGQTDKSTAVTFQPIKQLSDPTILKSSSALDSLQLDKVPVVVTKSSLTLFNDTTAEYYSQFSQGFVVQITGFSQPEAFQSFIKPYRNNQFYSYFRLLKDQPFLVLTSKVYATWAEATKAMNLMPKSLTDKQPWIKSIAAIHNEIISFELSQ